MVMGGRAHGQWLGEQAGWWSYPRLAFLVSLGEERARGAQLGQWSHPALAASSGKREEAVGEGPLSDLGTGWCPLASCPATWSVSTSSASR